MTQILYTRDQLIDLRTTGTARVPPTDVIARVNTLFRRRGCRAGRKVKVKLQRRALGIHYSHGDHSGSADVNDAYDVQYRTIPTIITDRSASSSQTPVRENRISRLISVRRLSSWNAVSNLTTPTATTTQPPTQLLSCFIIFARSLRKTNAVQLLATAEMDAGHFFWTRPDPTHSNSDQTRPGPVILRCSEVQKL